MARPAVPAAAHRQPRRQGIIPIKFLRLGRKAPPAGMVRHATEKNSV
jgi:hypothetical protein